MNVATETSVSIKAFSEALDGLEIMACEIPKFNIPNWPEGVTVDGNLGVREYRIPRSQDTQLLQWETGKRTIKFGIDKRGIRFSFIYDDEAFHSSSDSNLGRLAAAVLFDTFKEEVFKITFSKLKESAEIHNEVADKAMKAFEPFVPFVVADTLSL